MDEIIKNMASEAFTLKTEIKENDYIKLMEVLKDMFNYITRRSSPKEKYEYLTRIIIATSDWKESHSQDYDELESINDMSNGAKVIEITSTDLKEHKLKLHDIKNKWESKSIYPNDYLHYESKIFKNKKYYNRL